MKNKFYRRKLRFALGSSISELPPALFLLFFFAFFPMLDLIFLGLVYASCVTLNNLEVAEAAKTPASMVSDTFNTMQNNWQTTGLGRLTAGGTQPKSEIVYANIGSDPYVTVNTAFTVQPFMTVPFFKGIPGLSSPWSFTVSSKRVLENANYASQ